MWVTSEADGKVFVVDTTTNTLSTSIDVGARPRSIAFDRGGKRAFVTLEEASSVAIVDAVGRKIERVAKFEGKNIRSMGIAISPDDSAVYVTTGRGKSVLVLDAADGRERLRVAAGERPWGIGITRDGTKLYAANGTSNDVSVIDTASARTLTKLAVGARP